MVLLGIPLSFRVLHTVEPSRVLHFLTVYKEKANVYTLFKKGVLQGLASNKGWLGTLMSAVRLDIEPLKVLVEGQAKNR